jgi:hypothetical protein
MFLDIGIEPGRTQRRDEKIRHRGANPSFHCAYYTPLIYNLLHG